MTLWDSPTWVAAKTERDAKTHVYFVEGAGLIKIGYATWPVDRFFKMLTGCPIPLSLLASAPGGPTLENRLHHEFAEQRSHGEWFRRSQGLDEIIAAAPVQYGPEYHNRLMSLARKTGYLGKVRAEARRAQTVAQLNAIRGVSHDR